MEDGGWRMEDGGGRMEDGGWRMEDGGWRMEDGGWRMEDAPLSPVTEERTSIRIRSRPPCLPEPSCVLCLGSGAVYLICMMISYWDVERYAEKEEGEDKWSDVSFLAGGFPSSRSTQGYYCGGGSERCSNARLKFPTTFCTPRDHSESGSELILWKYMKH
ncbi:Eukaryotic translation initiation factor 3 subunit A [Liparis tanakae]|uniref:Eukaryotic translation initiation factor 3 subunit A n=1 Tax=Liparis tanakae TaxID=230148 RepID=A0A4Z2GGJ2_9TELE|nr:Eukaryotic translation initiation factor 3 subunit A [Liparis tanakae]